MTEKDISIRLKQNEIEANPQLQERLCLYSSLLTERNRHMDLTAADDEEEILDKHFIDSLTVLKTGLLEHCKTLIDVGTGAGFPGMVIAMARPDIQVTLLDAQRKRLDFLEEIAERSGMKNIKVLHARAEDAARRMELRETFDIACARAVAPLNILSEYILPFVRIGGMALCWKGPGLKEEMDAGRKAAFILGAGMEEPVICRVYGREWKHVILPMKKEKSTPNIYPRKAGTPKQKPLGVKSLS